MKLHQVSHYKIIRMIRNHVAEAEDLRTRETVILKVCPFGGKDLIHPDVCRRTGSFEDGGRLIQVYEFIDGITLKEAVREKGTYSPAEASDILIRLTDILSDLHQREERWICGDLKPSNIMIRGGGSVCLIDTEAFFPEAEAASKAGTGTKGYAAPEQFGQSPAADIRSEIFSIGSIFFEMITGKSLREMNYRIVPAGNLVFRLKNTPAEITILKCLKVNPEERFQTLAELKKDLFRSRQ